MDSNNINHSNGSGCHFLPTSTTSPNFFDLSSFHLDSPSPSLSFPHLLSSPPTTASSAVRRGDPPEGIINAAPPPHQLGPTRPSKKRSRASRRVPTTVLTTDTSNFRAMVQEFTGIPAPPFSSAPASTSATSLHFPRSLNLIPSTSPTPSSFLLKPFPHKFQSTNPTSNSAPPPVSEFNYRGNPNSTPINFQSLLHSQLVNLPQPAAQVINSGGLDLPGIIGPTAETQLGQLQPPPGPMSADKRLESAQHRGEGLMESWICSSD